MNWAWSLLAWDLGPCPHTAPLTCPILIGACWLTFFPRGFAQPLPERPHCAQMWPHIARQLPQPQHQDHMAGAFGEPPALPQLSRIPVSRWVSPSCHLTSRISRRDKNPTPPSLRSFRSEVRPWLLHPGPRPLWSPKLLSDHHSPSSCTPSGVWLGTRRLWGQVGGSFLSSGSILPLWAARDSHLYSE